ncbi:MAG: hypothetical protein U5K99_06135 [Anaerolineales bacterium]|nr:hypothetical protein [Anaerolineales bacterium]
MTKLRKIHLLLILALAAPLALSACQTHDGDEHAGEAASESSSGDEHAGDEASGDEHAGDSAE